MFVHTSKNIYTLKQEYKQELMHLHEAIQFNVLFPSLLSH